MVFRKVMSSIQNVEVISLIRIDDIILMYWIGDIAFTIGWYPFEQVISACKLE